MEAVLTVESLYEYNERKAKELRMQGRYPDNLLDHQWVMFTQPKGTPFDNLTETTLKFLLERTDFEEPWRGMGFATEVKAELTKALERKLPVTRLKELLYSEEDV